tara:strand:- start:112 stop:1665 length:1554 start_codon:yes stop_codon:yes gene_type:complete
MPKRKLSLEEFEEIELDILRDAVDKIQDEQGRKAMMDDSIKDIIDIVENFLRKTQCICYGGTAINNLLPINDQFYNKDVELPDYDFYSDKPLEHAKELADIYYEKGYTEVVAQSGMHAGTFKVFVNFIPVADITYLPKNLYNKIKKDSQTRKGIYYCSINYLRMSMYLELSRPHGDVSRWPKVLKRLSLFNKHYPLRGKNCNVDEIQRLFQYGIKKDILTGGRKKTKDDTPGLLDEDDFINTIEERIFTIVRESLIKQGCVFFGAFANRLYLKTTKNFKNQDIPKIPDFDVLSEDPNGSALIIKERLESIGVKNIKIILHEGIGEVVAPHYEIRVGPESCCFIYEPLACHSYNVIPGKLGNIRIATLDTMLSFYLAFLYSERPYYNNERITCMSEFLYRVQEKNRLEQKGLLKRFSMKCYGTQHTKEDIRSEKTKKYEELKDKRGSKDWEWYFLRYEPAKEKQKSTKVVSKSKKKSKKKSKTKNKKNKTNKKVKKNKKVNKKVKKKNKSKRRKPWFR